MLWVGWYGFNAGSAVASDGIAANAFTTTTLATAVAATVWPLLEWITRGKPSILGFCSGAVAGLVVITPATGFVTPSGAVLIGVLAAVVPFLACTKLKAFFKYDDALDTFGVHGVGGTLGALLTGFLATPEANANLNTNLAGLVGKTLWLEQLKAMGLTLALSVVATAVIGLRAEGGPWACGRPSTTRSAGWTTSTTARSGYHPEEISGHSTEEAEGAMSASVPATVPAITGRSKDRSHDDEANRSGHQAAHAGRR